MKRKYIFVVTFLAGIILSSACRERVVYQTVPVTQAPNAVQVRQDINLDPAAVLNLAATSNTAPEFESKLASSGVWNISTTGNGQLDIPKVVESAPNGVRTFTILAIDPSNGQETFIANVPVTQQGSNQAVLSFNGNPAYYTNPYYSIHMPIAEMLMWHYLFNPHPYYAQVWAPGFRPAYYGGLRYRDASVMQTVTTTVVKRPAQAQAAPAVKVTTPYDNRVSTAAKAAQVQRANPMAGRSFNEKNSNQSIRVGPNTAGANTQQKSAAASVGSSNSSASRTSSVYGSNRTSSSSSRPSSNSSSSRSSSSAIPRRR